MTHDLHAYGECPLNSLKISNESTNGMKGNILSFLRHFPLYHFQFEAGL